MISHLSPTILDPALVATIDNLQNAYIGALDSKDLTSWLDCFSSYGSYTCISRENEERKLPIAIMLDDTRERLVDRVTFIREVWHGTFEDYSTRHFVQRISSRENGDGRYLVTRNVLVSYTPEDGPTQTLVTGRYLDEVVVEDGGRTVCIEKSRARYDRHAALPRLSDLTDHRSGSAPTGAPFDDGIAGRVALITGGGAGIGRAISLEWARRGGVSVVTDRKRIGCTCRRDGHPSRRRNGARFRT